MRNWIDVQIAKAGWRRFIVLLALVVGFSVCAFMLPGPWAKIVAATSIDGVTPVIPELMFGFPEGQPAAAFAALDEATNAYIILQIIDLAFVSLSVLMTIAGVALGLKRFNLHGSAIRYLLLAPVFYFLVELIENGLLAAMASGWLAPEGVIAGGQQLATSAKFIADTVNSFVLAAAIIASVIAAATKPFRKKPAPTG